MIPTNPCGQFCTDTYIFNETMVVGPDAIDGVGQTRQILESVTIKCNIKFINCSII